TSRHLGKISFINQHLHWSLSLFSSFKCLCLSGVSCEDLTPVNSEQFTIEGNSVTLIYNYLKLQTNDYFFWYRQYPGKPPEFLISHSATGALGTEQISGLKVKVEQKQLMMNISSAAVSDSAVYYCALRPTVTGNSKTLYKNLWSKETENSTTSTRGTHTLFNSDGLMKQFHFIFVVIKVRTSEINKLQQR
uniref:Immunoglobulin V-set domain-containing protein n=1 Tax=Anabas testudineus TaxID=64144 RepID=A0A3Q1HWM0_ANATE